MGLTLENLWALGAPFDRAQLDVSLGEKRARMTIFVPGLAAIAYPHIEFPIDSDFEAGVVTIIATATEAGILHKSSQVTVVHVDSLPESKQSRSVPSKPAG